MTCTEFLHFLDAVPLRLKSGRELRIARQHATACPRCAVLLAEAESLEQALGSLPTAAPPDRLVAGVMERVHMEAPERPTVRQPAPETGLVGATNREKLGWAVAIVANFALLGAYLQTLNTSAWLSRVLSPAVGLQADRVSWMVGSGSRLLIVAAGVLLLAISILALTGGSERPPRPAS